MKATELRKMSNYDLAIADASAMIRRWQENGRSDDPTGRVVAAEIFARLLPLIGDEV